MRWYEGMFLFDSALATKEGEDVEGYLKELLGKHGATIKSFKRWDDRKLAYEVEKVRRGTYYLTTYEMDPVAVSALKRDCNLSEKVLRHLILQDDDLLGNMEVREELKRQREEEAAKQASEGLPPRRRPS